MRRFILKRNEDISGVSGTGVVAEGALFHNGHYALCWFGDTSTIEVGDSIEDLVKIHGHEGRTIVVWVDEQDVKDFREILGGSKE